MGSEIIIPGTPLDQIPVYDRPVFDPSKQNGFPGSFGNLAAPGSASTVQRLRLNLNNQTWGSPATPISNGGSAAVAAGAQIQFPTVVNYQGPVPVLIAVSFPEAVATTPPNLQNKVNHPMQSGVILFFQSWDWSNWYFQNADSVSHQVQITVSPLRPMLENAMLGPLNLATLLGLNVAPTDLLRIRRLSVQLAGDQNVRYSENGTCLIYALPGAAQPTESIGAEFTLRGMLGERAGATSPNGYGQRYILDSPVDILGTDLSLTGAAPMLLVNFMAGGGGPGPFNSIIAAQLDYYPGANS